MDKQFKLEGEPFADEVDFCLIRWEGKRQHCPACTCLTPFELVTFVSLKKKAARISTAFHSYSAGSSENRDLVWTTLTRR
jgi:hypothetical protein